MKLVDEESKDVSLCNYPFFWLCICSGL